MDRNHADASHDARREEAVTRRLGDALDRLGRLTPQDAGECPDPEQIAAYQTGALTPEEIAQCEGHFAACPRCREILSVLADIADEPLSRPAVLAPEKAQPAKPTRSRSSWLRSLWFVPALAATAALTLWLIVRVPRRSLEPTSPAWIAEAPSTQQPSPAPPPSYASGGGLPAASPGALAAPKESREAQNYAPASGLGGVTARPQMLGSPPQAPAATSEAPAAAVQGMPGGDASTAQNAPPSQSSSSAESATEAASNAAANATASAAQPASAPAISSATGAPSATPQSEMGTLRRAPASPVHASSAQALGGTLIVVVPNRRATANSSALLTSPPSAIAWRAGVGGLIERSSDGGRTWQRQQSPLVEDWLAGSAASDTICWLVGRNGAIARTADGRQWQQVPGPAMAADASGKQRDWASVIATDAQTAVVGSAGQIRYITHDAGKTWQQQP